MQRLIKLPEVLARCGVSAMTVWRRERAGGFPSRVRLGPNSVAWVEAEVAAWCEQRIAERDARLQKQQAYAHKQDADQGEAP
jgi:prophage regulatory protein